MVTAEEQEFAERFRRRTKSTLSDDKIILIRNIKNAKRKFKDDDVLLKTDTNGGKVYEHDAYKVLDIDENTGMVALEFIDASDDPPKPIEVHKSVRELLRDIYENMGQNYPGSAKVGVPPSTSTSTTSSGPPTTATMPSSSPSQTSGSRGRGNWGRYALDIKVKPSGGGYTKPIPPGKHFGNKGRQQTLLAVPNPGYRFKEWEFSSYKKPVYTPKATVTVSRNPTRATAVFEKESQIVLDTLPFSGVEGRIQLPTLGWHHVTPMKLDSNSSEDGKTAYFVLPKIVSQADGNYVFKQWKGCNHLSENDSRYGQIKSSLGEGAIVIGYTNVTGRGTNVTGIYQKQTRSVVPIVVDSSPPTGIETWVLLPYIKTRGLTRYETDGGAEAIGKTVYVAIPKEIHDENGIFRFESWKGATLVDESDPQYQNILQRLQPMNQDVVIGTSIVSEKGVEIIANYKSSGRVRHEDRGRLQSSYQMGAVPYREARGAIGKAAGWAGGHAVRNLHKGPFGKRWFGHGDMPKNPALQAAKNKGLRQLNGIAKKWHKLNVEPVRKEGKTAVKKIREMRKAYQLAIKEALKTFKKTGDKQAAAGQMDPIGLMGGAVGSIAAGSKKAISSAGDELVIETIKQQHEEVEKYTSEEIKKIEEQLHDKSKQLEDYLGDKAKSISLSLSRIYRFGLQGPEEQELYSYLVNSAAPEVAMKFMTRTNKWWNTTARGFKYMQLGYKTWSGAYENFREQIMDFITGPWIIGALVLLAEFFLAAIYLPPAVKVWAIGWALFVAAVAMVIKPGEDTLFLEALVGGAMIGLSAFIFVFGFANMFEMTAEIFGWGGFFILFLSFLGVFEIYEIRGFPALRAIAVIMILFGYITLGPYAGYTQLMVGEVKAPVMISLAYLKQGLNDVWLMATNPSEWYAQQQLRNVRPETPLSYPKGVEITYLRAMPDAVPARGEFSISMVYENQGSEPARNVVSNATCVKNCQQIASTSSSSGSQDDVSRTPDRPATASITGQATEDEVTRSTGSRVPIDSNVQASGNSQVKDTGTLLVSEGDNVEFGPFQAAATPREFAKVEANVKFTYDTASSLKVTIMDEAEMSNQFRQGLRFEPVQAIGKAGVAAVSLNVGPQPLADNKQDKLLLVSVLNNRINIEEDDFSKVILDENTRFIIKVDKSIATFASNEACSSPYLEHVRNIVAPSGDQIQEYRIKEDKPVEIEPIETGEIYSFYCRINLKDIDISKTGLITIELKNYRFSLSQTKNIMITEPLGVGEEIVTDQTGYGGVQTTTDVGIAVGKGGYCATKISKTGQKCSRGEGDCDSTNECGFSSGGQQLYCKSISSGTGVGITFGTPTINDIFGAGSDICCLPDDKVEETSSGLECVGPPPGDEFYCRWKSHMEGQGACGYNEGSCQSDTDCAWIFIDENANVVSSAAQAFKQVKLVCAQFSWDVTIGESHKNRCCFPEDELESEGAGYSCSSPSKGDNYYCKWKKAVTGVGCAYDEGDCDDEGKPTECGKYGGTGTLKDEQLICQNAGGNKVDLCCLSYQEILDGHCTIMG